MEGESLAQKEKVLRRMIDAFKPERVLYMISSFIAVLALFGLVIYSIVKEGNSSASVIGLFAPAGVIGFCCSQLLRMWGDSLKFISGSQEK